MAGNSGRYIRIADSKEVWGVTYKCASTSMLRALPAPHQYTDLRPGDHVALVVRDPHDRLVSGWKWFASHHNCYIRDILKANPADHETILDKRTPFKEWVRTALKYENPHWLPQTTLHPRWREFELIPITDLHKLGWGHEKKTRDDNSWRQFYDEEMLSLVDEVYAEDLEMWKEVTNGTNTRARRVL